MLDQDNNFYLINLSILITCLLASAWILLGEVTNVNDFWEVTHAVYKKSNTWSLTCSNPNISMHLFSMPFSIHLLGRNSLNNEELHWLMIISFILVS